MTAAQCQQALDNGAAVLRALPGNCLLLGEMGIGNTSAASLLMSRLAGLDIVDCTGAGTGLDAPAVQRKIGILRQVLARHPDAKDPLAALAAFGGFEIATMVGAVLQAAAERRVIVVDGFIASAAVLVASALQPAVLQRCVFAHQSGERGHALMLAHLKAEPLLDLGLRLGEGSGAALAWPLLMSACAILREMASFESAGVARADGSPQRFYSLSAQIQRERKAYYDILERTQRRSMDVTEWLAWFLDTLHCAVDQAQHTLDAARDAALIAEINALLEVKMRAGEAATSPRWPGIHAFIEAELARNAAEPVQPLPVPGHAALDALLHDTVLQFSKRPVGAAQVSP